MVSHSVSRVFVVCFVLFRLNFVFRVCPKDVEKNSVEKIANELGFNKTDEKKAATNKSDVVVESKSVSNPLQPTQPNYPVPYYIVPFYPQPNYPPQSSGPVILNFGSQAQPVNSSRVSSGEAIDKSSTHTNGLSENKHEEVIRKEKKSNKKKKKKKKKKKEKKQDDRMYESNIRRDIFNSDDRDIFSSNYSFYGKGFCKRWKVATFGGINSRLAILVKLLMYMYKNEYDGSNNANKKKTYPGFILKLFTGGKGMGKGTVDSDEFLIAKPGILLARVLLNWNFGWVKVKSKHFATWFRFNRLIFPEAVLDINTGYHKSNVFSFLISFGVIDLARVALGLKVGGFYLQFNIARFGLFDLIHFFAYNGNDLNGTNTTLTVLKIFADKTKFVEKFLYKYVGGKIYNVASDGPFSGIIKKDSILSSMLMGSFGFEIGVVKGNDSYF